MDQLCGKVDLEAMGRWWVEVGEGKAWLHIYNV